MRWLLLLSGWLCWVQCLGQAGNGLRAEYYSGPAFNRKVLVRTDRQVDFSWDGYTLPAPGVSPNSFSVRWTGKLYAPVSGPYKFTAVVDDGMRIWVNGKLAMNEWQYQKQKVVGQAVNLKAGEFYDLKIEYYNAGNGGYAQLNWNLVNESGKNPAFESAPQQRVSGQFLYNGPARKPAPVSPLVAKPKPVPPPPVARPKPTSVPPIILVKKPPAKRPLTLPPPVLTIAPPVSAPVVAPPAPPEPPTVVPIAFAQSDYQLMPAACTALTELARMMQRDTMLRLTVAGHTDNVGDPRLNLALSENRAKVVQFYLTRQGISERRMTLIGYGGSQPVAPNDTEANRVKNRRVEVGLRR